MIIGYCRVSTEEQDNAKFHPALREAGANEIIEEKISSKKSWKNRKLSDLYDRLSDGDTIVSPELSRIGRTMVDTLDFIEEIRKKGVTVISLKDNLTIRPQGDASSDMQMHMLMAVAQFERTRLSERTKEGLENAKRNGKKLGGYRRKGVKVSDMSPKDRGERNGGRQRHPARAKVIRQIRAGNSVTVTANANEVSRASIYKWMEEEGLKKGLSK